MPLGQCIADVTVWGGDPKADPIRQETEIIEVTEIDPQEWERELEIRIPLGDQDVFIKVKAAELMKMVTDAFLAKI